MNGPFARTTRNGDDPALREQLAVLRDRRSPGAPLGSIAAGLAEYHVGLEPADFPADVPAQVEGGRRPPEIQSTGGHRQF
jgi:hypothetical protein